MKIEGPGKTGKSQNKKKTGKGGSPDGSFSNFLVDKSEGSQQSSAAGTITSADALLSVQAAEDPAERAARQRMANRAEDLLDKLEAIRVSMLTGNLTIGDMIDIADMVARHRERISDPTLTAILDEIDLRAQIELAKMRVTLDDLDDKAASRE